MFKETKNNVEDSLKDRDKTAEKETVFSWLLENSTFIRHLPLGIRH